MNIFNYIFSKKEDDFHTIITIFGLKLKYKNINKIHSELLACKQMLATHKYIIDNCIDIKQFPISTGIIRKYQLANAKVLQILDLICNKYNISYWLDFGTCLGAVRHGGFIPWDDDIDIGMLREDYNRLIPILKKELPSDFEINEGKNYPNKAIIRIIYKHSAIQLDIFPYDRYYKSTLTEEEYKELDKNINNARNIFHKKYMKDFYAGKAEFPRKELDEVVKKYINKNNETVSDGILFRSIDMDYLSPRILYYNDIFPLSKIKFDNYILSCSNNLQAFLDKTYGEWNKFPNIIVQHQDISSRMNLITNIDDELSKLEIIYTNIIRRG